MDPRFNHLSAKGTSCDVPQNHEKIIDCDEVVNSVKCNSYMNIIGIGKTRTIQIVRIFEDDV